VATGNGHLRPTDPELVKRAREGDPSAFHELVDRYANLLFALAVSLGTSTADAEDMIQETFSGAFRGLGGFRGEASVKTWLTRILIRQRARHLRSAHKRNRTFIPLETARDSDLAVSSAYPATDARLDVAAAIRSLSPDHQEVIALREIQGLSYEEIAEILEVPRGTVESRLFRARRQLQERLRGYLG